MSAAAMDLAATMTPLHWAILAAIVAACLGATVGLILGGRAAERHGRASSDAFIPDCADVAALERDLPDFRLTYFEKDCA